MRERKITVKNGIKFFCQGTEAQPSLQDSIEIQVRNSKYFNNSGDFKVASIEKQACIKQDCTGLEILSYKHFSVNAALKCSITYD